MYLTGGNCDAERAVSIYDINSNEWKDGPKLNHGRYFHTSVCLGERVYVFGGHAIGSIESLRVGG